MTTVRDIAREAGVSPMTVSNVVNGRHSKVSPATVDRVREVMDRLGYVPSAPARALSAKNSKLVALVYGGEDVRRLPLSNPHDSVIVGEVERHVSMSGRYLMIHAAEDIVTTAANLRTWHVDGAIFLGTVADEVDELRERYDVPMVFIDNYSSSPAVSNIGIDDFRGGYLAAQHLIAQGHERLCFVGPQIRVGGVVHQRYAGWAQALDDAGLPVRPEQVIACHPDFDEGRDLAVRLAATDDRPTGIFATADILAIGLLHGFRISGVDVPADVSIVGFDDLPESARSNPPLTTIRQDVPAKARAAVEALVGLMEDPDGAEARRVTLGVELVARDTVGPPPAPTR
ncbi:LacI family DNA-binding transcriptional regulator [Cellulomonas timonensis]|uniref:LacI family DNA-binding transcriptional regulator n=1 Tax=Cellulomonas timonensis TaxID=1689271 RepID=UPI000A7B0774|nr:LacI family DNA-binding transcriptional regulator [Cellulomonas timonensis]